MPFMPAVIKRFEEKFIKGDEEECWEWAAGKSGNYGAFSYQLADVRAHVMSFRIYKGVTKGLFVLHKCDNPLCVNPSHLFLGTQLDNMRDMENKQRSYRPGPTNPAKHEHHGRAKLSLEDVKQIRSRYKRSSYHCSNTKNLAKEFGVSPSMIVLIVKNTNWKGIQP